MNRNQWFMLGLVVLLVGLQLRMVNSYVLNADATKFLNERSAKSIEPQGFFAAFNDPTDTFTPLTRRVIRPPEWSGWCLLSVGAVVVLQSLAMRKPD